MDKTSIESRINSVIEYRGSINLCTALTNAMRDMRLGSDPNWIVARACMTPAEYIAFGRDGRPWNFMKGKPDMAQRAIDAARGVVNQVAKDLDLWCDWPRVGWSGTSLGFPLATARIMARKRHSNSDLEPHSTPEATTSPPPRTPPRKPRRQSDLPSHRGCSGS